MRVLMFRSAPWRGLRRPESPRVLGGRWLALRCGAELQLYDLAPGAPPREPVWRLAGVESYAVAASTLATFDRENGIRRWEIDRGGRVRQVSQFARGAGAVPWPPELTLSRSGDFLVAETPPGRDARTGTVAVFDTRTGERTLEMWRTISCHASFCTLRGAEVLFLTAPGYMCLRMVDAASGRILRAFDPAGEGYCHAGFDLSPDGRRLLAFGCFWGVPYSARLYNATPWTGEGSPPDGPQGGPPLPVLFEQRDDVQYEPVLSARFAPARDGLISVVSQVEVAERPAAGIDEDADMRACVPDEARPVDDALRALPPATASALIMRHVDPETGEVRGWSVAAVPAVSESDVHPLSDHRVLLVATDGVHRVGRDGAVEHDVALSLPAGKYGSLVVQDGETVYVAAINREDDDRTHTPAHTIDCGRWWGRTAPGLSSEVRSLHRRADTSSVECHTLPELLRAARIDPPQPFRLQCAAAQAP